MRLHRVIIASALSFLLTSCAATFDLEEKWAPLTQIVERPGNDKWMTTIGSRVYVANLASWLERNPLNSVRFDNHMAHEQVHSVRQHNMGITKFLAKYLTDQSFRLKEEQLGWYVSIKLYQKKGYLVDPAKVATSLAKYKHKLDNYDALLKWAQDVVSGRWKPAEGELPDQYKDL